MLVLVISYVLVLPLYAVVTPSHQKPIRKGNVQSDDSITHFNNVYTVNFTERRDNNIFHKRLYQNVIQKNQLNIAYFEDSLNKHQIELTIST